MGNKVKFAVAVVAVALAAGGRAWGQDPVQQPAAKPADEMQTAAPATPVADAPPAISTAAPIVHTQWTKKSKTPYTGPTTVIELTPTPMLDEEGKQRLDPDGKPMLNPPVKQERDKYGHPLFDPYNRPVFQTATDRGYDEKGKKLQVKKEKPPKMISMSVASGTLTVDGMIGKAALNYDIKDFHYVYLYAPWIGAVVVSNVEFPGSRLQANAFDQHTLTVTVGDHQFQVYSEKALLGKKPAPAYVAVDRGFKLPSQVPVMGYGTTLKAPYQWPGAKSNPESKAYVKPPPVPESLRPVALLPPCPPGQMRQTDRVVLPGEDVPTPPCVLIMVRAKGAASGGSASAGTASAQSTAAAVAPPPSQP
jgi:hypothetical protein